MFSLLVSRHFAKRCEMDTSLLTYVLPISLLLLLLFHRLAAIHRRGEGRKASVDAWTRSSDNALCGIERREERSKSLSSHPIRCLVTLMGYMGDGGGTIVILAGHEEMKGLEREEGALLGRCPPSMASMRRKHCCRQTKRERLNHQLNNE